MRSGFSGLIIHPHRGMGFELIEKAKSYSVEKRKLTLGTLEGGKVPDYLRKRGGCENFGGT